MLLCDFHIHTTYSDGSIELEKVIDLYGQAGFDAIAITDHVVNEDSSIGKLAHRLKYTVKERRPDGNKQSFPSGHVAIVVQSAEFMRKRYGWAYGLPAYAVATYVGFSRAETGAHYTRDILAGALIAFVSTDLITTKYEGWNVQPVMSSAYMGINLSRNW